MHTLIVVGSGIKSIAHITGETKKVIQHADKVLYLVNEDNLKAWIQREAKEAESLEPAYYSSQKRIDAYHQITTHIVNEYHKVKNLCVVFYGHPSVFAESALNAVKKINAANGHAILLPAVSAMDCLFSDLQIDPGDQGCYAIDATELLIYERSVDVHAHTLLWQIANLGMADTNQSQKINVLCDYLHDFYPEDYQVCLYEAAILPTQKPRIKWLLLKDLVQVAINPVSTLYIPPMSKPSLSKKYLDLLEMDVEHYQLSADSNTTSK
ncbi:methylase [Legionella geestiana]|uniref:Methylase n=1 Tax=Legionella geestiana TaxID=45065 RepID=A0A0W0U1K1_9GAMM|nr:SAM-dependent methyltransferase [Legionella geestiana]KTD01950.1 methylase [Legionella geestiana]QBS12887.1 methylase [Legionella geestiana]QDQ39422.1 methylase [Legionella geestiana]STX54622.1 methylase [Legionella geestiana]